MPGELSALVWVLFQQADTQALGSFLREIVWAEWLPVSSYP